MARVASSMRFDFYPRPPRGGRRRRCSKAPTSSRTISIHALREEGDWLPRWRGRSVQAFLSTPSARRATYRDVR